MNYSFDIVIAEKYGVNEAIMIQNFAFWISKNKANNKHFHDGKIWTYNSKRAYSILFPFWSERQVRIILESLIKQGVLIKGNYNQSSYDRTLWYAFNDNTIGLLDTFHWTEASNQLDGSVRPIPDINTDINTDTKEEEKKTFSSLKDSLNLKKERTDLAKPPTCLRADTHRQKKPVLSDEEWLNSLKTNKAYEGIDIERLQGKMTAWCELKGRKPTKARLLNWLNREERPLTGNAVKPTTSAGIAMEYLRKKAKLEGEKKNAQTGHGEIIDISVSGISESKDLAKRAGI